MGWIRGLLVVVSALASMAAAPAIAQSAALDQAFARMRAVGGELLAIPDAGLAQMPEDALESLLVRVLTASSEMAFEVDKLGLGLREEGVLVENRLGPELNKSIEEKLGKAFEAMEKLPEASKKAFEERIASAMARLATPTYLKRSQLSAGLIAASGLRMSISEHWIEKRRLPEERDLADELKTARETLRKENYPADLSYAAGTVTLRYNASFAEGGVLTLAAVTKGNDIEFVCRANAPLRRLAPAMCEVP